ncbi:LysM peptidoglycan-binding domain-containing protein [Thiohalobacter sp. IOR34]|uniref:LysM peptidoglycan-binding domain-containing protein n=1 Tax=Thiohalobacter sp. IOR34 TaxID=3057176 RepID=UPI0025B1007C|nr:LysM peptidoglycan-binding domain-containing protein [Thiohalobacter sp. IOR34]WJW75620.1 LysM peptidoglycan-binding domain-containing protein [Thiohalobacter sp. IOR34]
MARKLFGFILAACFTVLSWADEIALNPDHPERYVVVPGDTLWDISARFLRDPWLWPEVWYANPQIENPHLIYPGDVIRLVYVDGRPQLRVERGRPTVKLSPHARVTRIDQAIPTIPIDAIRQFLTQPLVVSEETLKAAPYVLDSPDEHIVTGAGDRIYVRGISSNAYGRYNLFRPGEPFTDPETGELLGHEAVYVGDARVQRFGDPATLTLTRTSREVNIGDRLMPVEEDEIHLSFLPHPPQPGLRGQIISVLDGVSQIGQYQVVVINRGKREGMEVGHVLRVMQAGETIRDRIAGGKEKVRLPDEEAGLMLVFRTFDKVSFGLIMEATRPIHVLDIVTTP